MVGPSDITSPPPLITPNIQPKQPGQPFSIDQAPLAPVSKNSQVVEGGAYSATGLQPVEPDYSKIEHKSGALGEMIRPTWSEQFVLNWKKSQEDAYVGWNGNGVYVRLRDRIDLENKLNTQGASKITSEEANKRFPGMEVPFKEAIYPEVAQVMFDTQKSRTQYDPWLTTAANTPYNTNYSGKVSQFVAGLVEPENLALIGLGAVTFGFGTAPLVARVGGGVGAKVAAIYGANFAINSALEIPAYIQKKAERQNVTIQSEIGDVAINSALLTVGHVLVEGIKALRGKESIFSATERLKESAQAEEAGLKSDQNPYDEAINNRAKGFTQEGRVYSFEHMDHPSERPMYAGVTSEGSPVIHGDERAPGGLDLSDNAQLTNNKAANPEANTTGRVGEFKVPTEMKFLDLETPVDSPKGKEIIAALERRLGKIDTGGALTLDDVIKNLKDLKEELPPAIPGQDTQLPANPPVSALSHAVEIAKAMGYDGYKFINDAHGELSHGAIVFDRSAITSTGDASARNDIVPGVSREQAQAARESAALPQKQIYYDENIAKETAELAEAPTPTPEDKLSTVEEMANNKMNELKNRYPDDPYVQESLKEIAAMEAEAKQSEDMAKRMADCALGDVT